MSSPAAHAATDPSAGHSVASAPPRRSEVAIAPSHVAEVARATGTAASVGDQAPIEAVLEVRGLSIAYGGRIAVRDVDLDVARNRVTAIIGPSGCGKSTFLRSVNRMNDLLPTCSVTGSVTFHGVDLYAPDVEPVEVRRRIGMVFQKPTPFPKSIFQNVAYGLKLAGVRDDLDDRVERALRQAALWDEVSHRLDASAMGLSGGQQQRLCIARALAVEPEVLLMDEPCSALDPIATAHIEDLMSELSSRLTIVIVTHNMQQAARASDRTAFFTTEVGDDGHRTGVLVEEGATDHIFGNPTDERTEHYVTGRFG
jgi:phosphate transport system ATP-binding protein